jgi:hypothetical protein
VAATGRRRPPSPAPLNQDHLTLTLCAVVSVSNPSRGGRNLLGVSRSLRPYPDGSGKAGLVIDREGIQGPQEPCHEVITPRDGSFPYLGLLTGSHGSPGASGGVPSGRPGERRPGPCPPRPQELLVEMYYKGQRDDQAHYRKCADDVKHRDEAMMSTCLTDQCKTLRMSVAWQLFTVPWCLLEGRTHAFDLARAMVREVGRAGPTGRSRWLGQCILADTIKTLFFAR